MFKATEIRQRLITLKALLDRINRAWTTKDYENLMRFFVMAFPRIMKAERCSIFISSPDSILYSGTISTFLND